MKVVILAGGYGTRISEESYLRPKPMIEIGGQPILWHIMKIYSHYGYNDFIICCGYKGQMIKEYFANYFLYASDVTFDFSDNNRTIIHNNVAEPWRVTLIDTGLDTMTGGRIARIKPYITQGESFMLTYGDGVCDVDIEKLADFHKSHGKKATITAVQPGGRFGALDINEGDAIKSFMEKPKGDGAFVNGGFMVLDYSVFDYIKNGDCEVFEKAPLEDLAKDGELMAYKHTGFWQPMDTLRDKELLEGVLKSGNAPWVKW